MMNLCHFNRCRVNAGLLVEREGARGKVLMMCKIQSGRVIRRLQATRGPWTEHDGGRSRLEGPCGKKRSPLSGSPKWESNNMVDGRIGIERGCYLEDFEGETVAFSTGDYRESVALQEKFGQE